MEKVQREHALGYWIVISRPSAPSSLLGEVESLPQAHVMVQWRFGLSTIRVMVGLRGQQLSLIWLMGWPGDLTVAPLPHLTVMVVLLSGGSPPVLSNVST